MLSLFSFLLNTLLCPYPTPAPASFLPFALGPELGGWWVGGWRGQNQELVIQDSNRVS